MLSRTLRRLLAIAFVVALSLGATSGPAATGVVLGEVELHAGALTLADASPIVVYLDAGGRKLPLPKSQKRWLIMQAGAQFSPGFSVIPVGQAVEMRNDDTIFHNVFSYSSPNDFDLGIYPRGVSRFHTFKTPGLVRYYCSIHESMNGMIFVAPSEHFALIDPQGAFRINDVPSGSYELVTWSPFLPERRQTIKVTAGKRLSVSLPIHEQSSPAD